MNIRQLLNLRLLLHILRRLPFISKTFLINNFLKILIIEKLSFILVNVKIEGGLLLSCSDAGVLGFVGVLALRIHHHNLIIILNPQSFCQMLLHYCLAVDLPSFLNIEIVYDFIIPLRPNINR